MLSVEQVEQQWRFHNVEVSQTVKSRFESMYAHFNAFIVVRRDCGRVGKRLSDMQRAHRHDITTLLGKTLLP